MKNILYIFILLPILAFGQTQSENYIRTISYKVPTSQIPSPSNVQKVQNIIYYDGLGRPIQKIAHAQSNSGKDIVTHIEYDEFGRQAKDYLPFIPTSGSSLNLKTNEVFSFYGTNNFALSGNPNFETTSNPFSEKQYENSPLNRILKQGAPGNDWSIGSGHEIKIDYLFNSSNEVVNFAVSESGSLIDYGYYSPNLLYKTVTKDENWTSTDGNNRTMHEFKDNLGKVVLKRTFESNIAHDTYYVYNKRGDLSYVLPPMFIENLTFQTTNPLPCNFTKSIGYAPILTSVSGGPVVGGGNVSVIVSNGIIKVVFNAGFNESYINPTAAPIIENSPIQCNLPNMTLGIVSLSNHYYPYVVSIENNRLKVVQSGGVPQNQTMTSFNAEISAPFYQPATSVNSVPINLIDGLCYQYKYDEYNRLVEKKLPGKQWEFIVYDKLDRVVMTGPALSPFTSPTGNGWMITKYDVFSRPILTAWMPATVTSATRKTNQDNRNTATVLNESKTTSNTTVNGVGFRYTNTALPTSGYHVLTVNYYDDYNYPNAPTISTSVEGQPVFYNATTKPKGLPTGTYVRVPETSTSYKNEISYILYDEKARPIRNYTTNYLGGFTQVDTKLDWAGKTLYTLTTHKRITTSAVTTVKEAFEYTPQDRLLKHTHQINGGTVQLLVKNDYDELGQLIVKRVGGTDLTAVNPLQKVDYNYNIRGWLKSINDVDNLGTDLFAFKLSYNAGATPLYNGNISETYWRSNSDNILRKYEYHYDTMNRLLEANYKKPGSNSTVDSYQEKLTYDKNGNVKRLWRNGDLDANEFAIEIDDLMYTYHSTNPNQLMKVLDSSNHPQGFKDDSNGLTDAEDDYAYDDFGNLKKDQNKQISSITYNHLNLPTSIVFADGKSISYLYNAVGQKVRKRVNGQFNTLETVNTDYMDGFQYTNGDLSFFPHAEGYVNLFKRKNGTVDFNYIFQYRDHLGNNRMSFTKKFILDVDDPFPAEILEENHYYPFGMKHTSYNTSLYDFVEVENGNDYYVNIAPVSGDYLVNKYKYNGKEFQDELGLNFYDYGARNYDPAIGRWNVMDGKSELYFGKSPYIYALNTPVQAIDPDGNIVIFINGMHEGDGGKADYWRNGDIHFDTMVMDKLNDHYTPRYYDGSHGGKGGILNPSRGSNLRSYNRQFNGYGQGMKDAESIIKNLARDQTTGEIIETIKIVTHSMGGAYGKGFVKALKDYISTLPKEMQRQIKITMVADFDPFQAGSLEADPEIYTQQFSHIKKKGRKDSDGHGSLANERQKGDDYYREDENESGHSIFLFLNDIDRLQEGTYKWNGSSWECVTCK
jgi:RHS repeat-associated protein